MTKKFENYRKLSKDTNNLKTAEKAKKFKRKCKMYVQTEIILEKSQSF